jgi:hypothetical protein
MVYIKRVSSKKSRPAKKAGLQKKARYENKSCERAYLHHFLITLRVV